MAKTGVNTRLIFLLMLLVLHGCDDGGLGPPPDPPAEGDPTIAVERAFPGVSFSSPVAMLQAPGDSSRWFVVEKRGIVWTFSNDPTVSMATQFINIVNLVNSTQSESGLLGMAFHPNWSAGTRQIFLSYTRVGSPMISHVSRFFSLDSGATADPAAENILFTIVQDFSNHNGGNLAFGPDGYLYAGWGDGGSGGDPLDRAQDNRFLLGTITRINVDSGLPYSAPAGNPFSNNVLCSQGVGAVNCPEIYAWGLRNPWRWSFDLLTGELWVGDVGQNATEEINRVTVGENYGWRCREGSADFDTTGFCPGGFTDPITEYSHAVGFSVTGGYVYRGPTVTSLQGLYVFADYGSGRIFSVPAVAGIGTAYTEQLGTSYSISSFGQDSVGELFIVDYVSGGLYEIVNAP